MTEPGTESQMIHGYQPTEVECPYCGNSHGMRYRAPNGVVIYVCWCGAKKRETADG